MKRITTSEANRLTGYSESYLRKLARDKLVMASKKGNRWYFERRSLLSYKKAKEENGR